MSLPRPNQNTKINEVRENINSEYAEEIKLNIRCDEDDNHIAVVYCPNCLANLCIACSDSFHSRKAVSKHEVVRLTQKPEPPIYCYLHPQKTAELVCKEPNCEGINKPVCTMCHQYKTHKDHKYEILEDEYDKIRKNVANCLKIIETKRTTCDKNVDEYDKCISTYSSNITGFWKTERDRIDKFYSDAKTLALKTFDDFTNDRIETLRLLQNQYIHDKTKLDSMGSELRNIEEMKKFEVIKNGQNVEKMVLKAGKNIDEPIDLVSSKSCNITYPDFQLMNIQIGYNNIINSLNLNSSDISRNVPLQNQQKTIAVYVPYSYETIEILESRAIWTTEDKNNGKLYKYEDGRSIIHLNQRPDDNTIDSSNYKYKLVIYCWPGSEGYLKNELKDQMENKWWSRIFILINSIDGKLKNSFVNRIQEIATCDKRVKVINHCGFKELLDNILES